jgi:nucleoside phosphorylase
MAESVYKTNRQAPIDRADIGVITMREDEFVAVLRQFKPYGTVTKSRPYEVASLETLSEDPIHYDVILTRCLEQGPNTAAAVVSDMIKDFTPEWILLVGIAGSVPSADFTLGDVVCASRLHDFSISAWGKDKVTFDQLGGRMHPDVENLLASLPARHLGNWNAPDSIGSEKPELALPRSISDKRLYGSSDWKKNVLKQLKYHFSGNPRPPLVTVRPVASSGILAKDTNLMEQWLDTSRSIAAIEMELAGAYAASYREQNVRLLSVRGISDIVGFKRDDVWTGYACLTAAAFAAYLLASETLATAQKVVKLVKAETPAKQRAVIKSASKPQMNGSKPFYEFGMTLQKHDFDLTPDSEILKVIELMRERLRQSGLSVGTIIFVAKEPGSLRIRIRASPQDAYALFTAIQANQFKDLGITAATPPVAVIELELDTSERIAGAFSSVLKPGQSIPSGTKRLARALKDAVTQEPFQSITQEQLRSLKELTEKVGESYSDKRYSEIERQEYRLRLARQALELLDQMSFADSEDVMKMAKLRGQLQAIAGVAPEDSGAAPASKDKATTRRQGLRGATRLRLQRYEFVCEISSRSMSQEAAERLVRDVFFDFPVTELSVVYSATPPPPRVQATATITLRRGMHVLGDIVNAISGTAEFGPITVRRLLSQTTSETEAK